MQRSATVSTLDLNSLLDEVHADIRGHVATGFLGAEAIVEAVLDRHGDDADPAILRPHAQRFVREVIAAQLVEQATWPALTDCDRLDAAFTALEGEGIICRQNFSCCGTCGSAEIWDEIAGAQEAGRPARGYAFYHVQDTESAVEGYGLYLNYGAVEEGEAAALAVANEVVARLERHGLRVSWDGRWSRRIGVSLDWKRRWRA
jgi:hypothetical protein